MPGPLADPAQALIPGGRRQPTVPSQRVGQDGPPRPLGQGWHQGHRRRADRMALDRAGAAQPGQPVRQAGMGVGRRGRLPGQFSFPGPHGLLVRAVGDHLPERKTPRSRRHSTRPVPFSATGVLDGTLLPFTADATKSTLPFTLFLMTVTPGLAAPSRSARPWTRGDRAGCTTAGSSSAAARNRSR